MATDRILPQQMLLRQTLAAVRATPQVERDMFCLMLGRSTPLDGLGGILYYDADSTTADDSTQTFKPAHIDVAAPGRWRMYMVAGSWGGTANPNSLVAFGLPGQFYSQVNASGDVIVLWIKGANGWTENV